MIHIQKYNLYTLKHQKTKYVLEMNFIIFVVLKINIKTPNMETLKSISQEIRLLIKDWVPKFHSFSNDTITKKRNGQNRTIKQIIGHMVDSASNNIHRIIHLQYGETPLVFPNYATNGNNDRWIAIQNYQEENWEDLIQLWKYLHIHIAHIIQNINKDKLENTWISNSKYGNISLEAMVEDFPRHFKLHLKEIDELSKA